MAERIGFIGLGKMGNGMARNVLTAGYALTVYDVDEQPAAALQALWAARAERCS